MTRCDHNDHNHTTTMTLDYHDTTMIMTDDGNAKLRTTDDKHNGPQCNTKMIAMDNDQQ